MSRSVRYYSHLQLPSGYGKAALELAVALDRAKVDLDIRTIGPRDSEWSLQELSLRHIEYPDAVVVHTLPGDCSRVLEIEGLQRGTGPQLVAYTTWEALTAPAAIVAPLFENFDQVWVPSGPNHTAFGGREPERMDRLRVIPHCFDERVARPAPRSNGGDERFRFYWIGAWTARKNPGGLIRAFAHAFRASERVELIIHSTGCSMDMFVAALAATGLNQDELPTITLSNSRLTETALARLHRDSDCFVTAARGEAWNLPAFDAMLAGRHVISQFGLGSDEYLTDTSADLVDGLESPAQVDVTFTSSSNGTIGVKTVGAQGLSARSLWLEPSLSSLSDAMRSAFDRRTRAIAIHYDVAERFGYAAVADQVLHVLEQP